MENIVHARVPPGELAIGPVPSSATKPLAASALHISPLEDSLTVPLTDVAAQKADKCAICTVPLLENHMYLSRCPTRGRIHHAVVML